MLASEQRYLAEIILTQLTIKVPKIPILLVSPKFCEFHFKRGGEEKNVGEKELPQIPDGGKS